MRKKRQTTTFFCICKVTVQLWSLFFNLTGVAWTMPEHTSDLLSCWIRREGNKTQKRWWRVIPSCIWWTVWEERNGRCFEDRFNSMQKIKENCITNFHFWCKEGHTDDAIQLLDFLGSFIALNAEEYKLPIFRKEKKKKKTLQLGCWSLRSNELRTQRRKQKEEENRRKEKQVSQQLNPSSQVPENEMMLPENRGRSCALNRLSPESKKATTGRLASALKFSFSLMTKRLGDGNLRDKGMGREQLRQQTCKAQFWQALLKRVRSEPEVTLTKNAELNEETFPPKIPSNDPYFFTISVTGNLLTDLEGVVARIKNLCASRITASSKQTCHLKISELLPLTELEGSRIMGRNLRVLEQYGCSSVLISASMVPCASSSCSSSIENSLCNSNDTEAENGLDNKELASISKPRKTLTGVMCASTASSAFFIAWKILLKYELALLMRSTVPSE
ncbi:hypothetical protein H5410_032636 [Solanum commersonii]|uniref:Uncharacterized protein n=1 Tax=Solanum commersonii TaxID=4109 RepID=A0A9J5YLH4_SOLCO|nr:hypothetical protein H5410_032636 [Solanum commersonii]